MNCLQLHSLNYTEFYWSVLGYFQNAFFLKWYLVLWLLAMFGLAEIRMLHFWDFQNLPTYEKLGFENVAGKVLNHQSMQKFVKLILLILILL